MPVVTFFFNGIQKVNLPNTHKSIVIDGSYTTESEAEIMFLKSLKFRYEVLKGGAKERSVPDKTVPVEATPENTPDPEAEEKPKPRRRKKGKKKGG